jgi:predicted deacylase
MKQTLRIGTAEAAPGTKAIGAVHVTNRPDGTMISLPVMLVNGVDDGPVVGMDGCNHGDEYEGPIAIQALVEQLDPKKLRGAFIGVPVVNVLAFLAMQRVTPNDFWSYPDVNRSYPGRPDGGLTGRIAYTHLTEIVARTNVMITIHSGASIGMLPPKLIYHASEGEFGRKTFEIAKAWGWEIMWRDGSFPGTLHGAAEARGIVCIAPEYGGTDRMPHLMAERVQRHITGTTNVMKYLGMLDGKMALPKCWRIVEGESHVSANHGGLLIYEPSFKLGESVVRGQKLARLVDLYGKEIEAIVAPYDGLAIMMRTIPVTQTGDWVVGIGKPVEVIENV